MYDCGLVVTFSQSIVPLAEQARRTLVVKCVIVR